MPRISGLFLYPVKSLRGFAVPSIDLDSLGFVGDRRFMVVDAAGRFLTQRTLPRMASIEASLAPGLLTLSVDGSGPISVSTAPDPRAPLRAVSVWKSEGLQAEDCGDAVAGWLSDFLKTPCRLVRIGEKFLRPMLKATARPGDAVAFADAFPLLVISEASLADLNDRIQENGGEPVPMNRFRPSIVVSGCEAFAEDTWRRIRVGAVTLRAGGPCARCVVTTTDQVTGERLGPEPLRTLAAYRRAAADPTDVNFGQNFIHETKHGTLRVGDAV